MLLLHDKSYKIKLNSSGIQKILSNVEIVSVHYIWLTTQNAYFTIHSMPLTTHRIHVIQQTSHYS